MENRKQFFFFRSYYDLANKIKLKRNRLEFYESVIEYAITGIEPNYSELSRPAINAFLESKSHLDTERRQSAEGRSCQEYKRWRLQVFDRDNYTCVFCCKRGVKLNAHHIKSYAHYPELRYDLSNGITLCEPCHSELHKLLRKARK